MRKTWTVWTVWLMAVAVAGFSLLTGGKLDARELERGLVSITFDLEGGYFDIYGAKYVKKTKLPATLYVVTDETSDGQHPTWDQVKEWSTWPGVEIGFHGFRHDHILDQSSDQIREGFRMAKDQFEAHGLFDVEAFAPPFGEANERLREIIRESGWITSLRNVKTADGPALNTVEEFDQLSIAVSDMRNWTDFEEVRALIDRAARDKEWLVISIQGISRVPSTDDKELNAKVFKKITKYLKRQKRKSELDIVPISVGVERMLHAQGL